MKFSIWLNLSRKVVKLEDIGYIFGLIIPNKNISNDMRLQYEHDKFRLVTSTEW